MRFPLCSFVGFGPLSKTEDPDKIKKLITDLKPNGGGDIPEMCLSALQVPSIWD